MKLTEAVQFRQPLFEDSQFKDFKTIVKEESPEISFDLQDDLKRIFLRMQNILGDDSYEFGSPIVTNPNFYINLTKKVTQHELRSYDLTDIMRAPREFPDLDRIDAYTIKLMEAMRMIMQKADDPARKEPEYDVVDRGNGYQILELYNYAAARMICNKYNLTHCIGSSNTSWFKSYGENKGRDTYYIITDAGRAVVVHSGGTDTFIITSHSNDTEVKDIGTTRGESWEIIEDLNSSIPLSNIVNVLLSIIPSQHHDSVKEIFYRPSVGIEAEQARVLGTIFEIDGASVSALSTDSVIGFDVDFGGRRTKIAILESRMYAGNFDYIRGSITRVGLRQDVISTKLEDALILSNDDLFQLVDDANIDGIFPEHVDMLLGIVMANG